MAIFGSNKKEETKEEVKKEEVPAKVEAKKPSKKDDSCSYKIKNDGRIKFTTDIIFTNDGAGKSRKLTNAIAENLLAKDKVKYSELLTKK